MKLLDYLEEAIHAKNEHSAREQLRQYFKDNGICYSSDRMEYLIATLLEDERAWSVIVKVELSEDYVDSQLEPILKHYEDKTICTYDCARYDTGKEF